jgi:hypothetical protein
VTALLVFVVGPVAAATAVPADSRPEPLRLAAFSEAPKLDGVLDEPVWTRATLLDGFVETWPGDNVPAPRATWVRLGVDAGHLYLGIEAEDDAGAVRATLGRRDDVLEDDHVRVLLDTFDDRRRAYVLVLNPFGIAQDGVWIEGSEVDYSFDLPFEARGRLGPSGYGVEVAVPLSSLRSAAGPERTWGLHVFRTIRHLDDTELSWRPLERGRARLLDQAGRIAGFLDEPPARRLELIPTWTLTEDRIAAGGSAPAGEESTLGATLRLALGAATVVDAAIRPDFAQIEADQPVITANQRFPLFFEEKRPFFLEGFEVFETPLTLLHTRTVVAPEVALKATHRQGSTTWGALAGRDRRSEPGGGGEAADFGVLRWQRELGAAGEVGLLATGFQLRDRESQVLALDGRWNRDSHTVWRGQAVATSARKPFYDPGADRDVLRRGHGLGYFVEGRRSRRLRSFTVRGEGRSEDFVADLGFARQVDLHRWSVTARHDAEPRGEGTLRSWSSEGTALLQTDWRGRPTYSYLYPRLFLRFARQTSVTLSGYVDYLQIREEELGPRRGPDRAGAFFGAPTRSTVYRGFTLEAATAPSERISVSILVDASWDVLDFDFGAPPRYPRVSPAALADPAAPLDPGTGRTVDTSLQLDWRPTDALRVALDVSHGRLFRDDTDRLAYDQRLATLRLAYQFDRAFFARLRWSYDSLVGGALGEALVAWTPSPGTAVYLGYEEPSARDPRRFRPADPFAGWRATRRTAFLKVSYRFGWVLGSGGSR